MMKKMVEQWNLETRGCPDTSSFKGKFTAQTEKLRGKMKGHKGKYKIAWQCIHHHRQW